MQFGGKDQGRQRRKQQKSHKGQVPCELSRWSQLWWPQLSTMVLPSGPSLLRHIPVQSQSLILSHHPVVPLSQKASCIDYSLQSSGKQEREAELLPKHHPSSPNRRVPLLCSMLPYSTHCLLAEVTCFGQGRSPAPETAPDPFCRSCSIWVELAGKW